MLLWFFCIYYSDAFVINEILNDMGLFVEAFDPWPVSDQSDAPKFYITQYLFINILKARPMNKKLKNSLNIA